MRNNYLDEQSLLWEVSTGNQQAFNQLFDNYYNVMGEYVLKVTKSMEVTEEIVQDAFVKVWQQRATLANVKNFKSYLFILCRNQTFDYLRKKAKERVLTAEFESYLNQSAEMAESESRMDALRTLIDESINKLPPQAQKVYVMSRYERLKYDEIARRLKISPETVKKHIQYSVSFIKRDLMVCVDAVFSVSVLVILTSI